MKGLFKKSDSISLAADRKTILKSIFFFVGSDYMVFLIRALVGFIIAKLLGPAELGIYGVFNLIISYGIYSEFGVQNSMNRRVPGLLVTGDLEGARHLEKMALTFSFISSLVVGLALVAWGLLAENRGLGLGIGAAGVVLVVRQLRNYTMSALRCRGAFGLMSLCNLGLSSTKLLFCILLIPVLGLSGLYITDFMAVTFSIVVVKMFRSDLDFRFAVSWKGFRSFFLLGLGLSVYVILVQLNSTAYQWVIVKYYSMAQYGLFTFAMLFINTCNKIPFGIDSVLYPHMLSMVEKTREARSVRKILERSWFTLALVFPPVLLGFFIAFRFLTLCFFPEYGESLPIALALSVGILSYIPYVGCGNLLIAKDLQNKLSRALGFLLALGIGAAWLLCSRGYSLISIALLISLFLFIRNLYYYFLANRQMGFSFPSALATFLKMMIPSVVAYLLFHVFDRMDYFAPGASRVLDLLKNNLVLCFHLVVLYVMAVIAMRGMGLVDSEIIRGIVEPFAGGKKPEAK